MTLPANLGRTVERLLGPTGVLPAPLRELLFERARAGGTPAAGAGAPDALARWADLVAGDAAAIGDQDLEAVRSAGSSDEEIFDATVCAAVGAALGGFERALALFAGGAEEVR